MTAQTTHDRMQQAKDALLYALHAAERELKPADVKRVESLVARTESLQASLRIKYTA